MNLRRELGMFVTVVLMCIGLYANNHEFFNFSNSGNLLRNTSMLGILAVGIAFVIITGGIDLSVGTLLGLTGVIIAKISSHEENCLGYSLWVGIPVAMGTMLLIGLVQGLIITRLDLQPFIVTLAGMLIFRGVSQTICQSGTLSIGDSPLSHLANNGLFMHGESAIISWPVVMFAAVLVVFGYLLHFTVFGRYIYAVGGNRDAAKYSGINVKRVETLTYVISAGLAGLAGICFASFVGGMDKGGGQSYELFAITAAVLGGCSLRGGEGSVVGVLVGCTMYRMIENGINMFQLLFQPLQQGSSAIYRLFRWILGVPSGHPWDEPHKSWDWTSLDFKSYTWHVPTEWTEIIIGTVLLTAVASDQIAHIVQARRRTRKVVPSQQVSPTPAVSTPVGTGS